MSRVARIDRVDPDAWERVRAVRLRALEDAPDAFCSTVAGESAKPETEWRRRLVYPQSITLVAAIDDVDVGLAFGAAYEGKPGCGGLFGMWVDASARGTGTGDALVQAVIDWAIERGYERLVLEVAEQNPPAIRLYERMGFEATDATRPLPPPRDYIVEREYELDLSKLRSASE